MPAQGIRATRIDAASFGKVFLEGPMQKQAVKATKGMLSGSWLLDRATLQDAYLANGFARRIIDKPAEEMTRAGFKLDDVQDETINEKIQSRVEELAIMEKLCLAIQWSRAFGGAGIVLGVKDGGNLESPLNMEKVEKLEFLRVYDRWEITEERRYQNANDENYGKVEIWRVSPAGDGPQVGPYLCHESRLLKFDGENLPNQLRLANQGWGASVLQKCIVEVTRLNNSHRWSEMMLERLQQAVHKIPDLASQLEDKEGRDILLKRVDIVDRVRSLLNTIVLDAQEEYELHTLTLTGVNDILDRHAEAVAAVTGIPVFVLMGRSPGGLNATSEGNEDAWFADVGNMQNTILRRPLVKLVELLLKEQGYVPQAIIEQPKPQLPGRVTPPPAPGASKLPGAKNKQKPGGKPGTKSDDDTGTESESSDDNERLEQWKICFEPLKVLSEKDKAESDSKKAAAMKSEADALNVYYSAGAMDPMEIRSYIATKPELAEHIDATIEPEPPAQTLLEQELASQQNAGNPGGGNPGGTGGSGGKG
jgi:phage-related protein (TIGR01555 family)